MGVWLPQRSRANIFFAVVVGLTLFGHDGQVHAQAAQPAMEAAIQRLQGALKALAASRGDKGGHREKAEALIKAAIAEVRAGIDFSGGIRPLGEPKRNVQSTPPKRQNDDPRTLPSAPTIGPEPAQ